MPRKIDNQQWLKDLIIYEDNRIAVVNKPRGIPVQGGTNINFSFDHVLQNMERPWKIVHRLDRETTGILIFAKHQDVAAKLAKLFHNYQIKKTYLAVAHGKLAADYMMIDQPLLEKKIGNEKLMMVDERGKHAITKVKLIKYFSANNTSLLLINPETGRKNQIRAHLSFLKNPIVGDDRYNFQESKKVKLMLHAWAIEFNLGIKSINLKAELPEYWDLFKNFL